ncbi:MAG: hypothetical protein IKC54_03150 [Clostridia bacterium]|nr:hypothetical protein [Clostridia bacterium]
MALDDKNRVDEMGIRKAPVPLYGNSVKQLPAVRQDFVLRPSLQIDNHGDPESLAEPSTAKDYQPKIKDVSKRWKRTKRTKNFFSGLIMLLATAVTLLPFIFAYFQIKVDFLPFKYVPDQYNVISNIIWAIQGEQGTVWEAGFATNWKIVIPDFIIAVGLLFVLCNLVKAIVCMCGTIKVRRFTFCSIAFVTSVLAVFVLSLVGFGQLGIKKIDFMKDVVANWQNNELVALFIAGMVGVVGSLLVKLINSEKYGYLR